jgi:hypothetical protein
MERKTLYFLACTALTLAGCGGSGDVTKQDDNARIRIYFHGSDQSFTSYDSFHASVYIYGDRNIIRLEDTPAWIVIIGDENRVYTEAGDINIAKTGNDNQIFQSGPFSN